MPFEQYDMFDAPQPLLPNPGKKSGKIFERDIQRLLIKDFGFHHWGSKKEALKSYLQAIETPANIFRLYNDLNWFELFQKADLFAPYESDYNDTHPDYILLTDIPYDKFNDSKGETEVFIILRSLKREFRIECKRQDIDGTAEDKLYKTALDLRDCGSKEAILLLRGDGFKPANINGVKKALAEYNMQKKCKTHLLLEKELPNFLLSVRKGANEQRV